MSRKIATASDKTRPQHKNFATALRRCGKLVRAPRTRPCNDHGCWRSALIGSRRTSKGGRLAWLRRATHEPRHAVAPASAASLANDDQRPPNVGQGERAVARHAEFQDSNLRAGRKVERGGRTMIPARLSAPPRRLKSRRDFVWPTVRPVAALH